MGADAGGRKACLMGFGSVTGVPLPRIRWIPSRELGHQPVPRDFGDDGGGGNGKTTRIALYCGFCGAGQGRQAVAIHQHGSRLKRQCGDGPLHRQHGCGQDIQPVDLPGRGCGDSYRRMAGQHRGQCLPLCRLEGFRVLDRIQQILRAIRGQHYRSRHYRPGPGAAADLIDPGNGAAMARNEGVFEAEIRHKRL